jgi:hypothetical protein
MGDTSSRTCGAACTPACATTATCGIFCFCKLNSIPYFSLGFQVRRWFCHFCLASRTSRLIWQRRDKVGIWLLIFVCEASYLTFDFPVLLFSNPYHNNKRPGTANVGPGLEKAPVSETWDLDKISDLKEEYHPIRDCLLSLIEALKNTELSAVDKRLLVESEKAVAVLLKRLARGDISDDISAKVLTMTQYITSYDFRSAQSVQTGLVNHDWKDHKDWLKGIKALLRLATKTWAR